MTEGSALVLRGDALHMPLPDNSVDLIITSPPYFALRSYRDEGEHYAGQIGSEETPQAFLAALWAATREMKRVLKPTGSMFINLGDKYAGAGPRNNENFNERWHGSAAVGMKAQEQGRPPSVMETRNRTLAGTARAKSLMGLPWRYAIGCIDDLGLILRAEIVWCLSGGARVYARTSSGDRPIMLRDLVRSYQPENVQLWNGTRWTQVLGWNRTPDDDGALEVEFRSGERVGCTSGHSWPTANGVKCSDELRVGDVVLQSILPEPDRPHYPGGLKVDDIGWLIGLYIAEGSRSESTIQIAGHINETVRHARLARIAQSYDGTCAVYQTSENGSTCNLRGAVLLGIIEQYVSPGTAKTKRLRKAAWQRSNQFLSAVVEGYLDGDGHYDAKNQRWRLGFTANDEWAADLRTLAARLGATLRLRRRSTRYKGRMFPGWGGEWRWQQSDHHNAKPDGEIVALRLSRARDFYDLGVAGEPHLFALASGLLTHNSKPNGLPESVTDRVRRSHEQWFHMVKEPKYFAAVDEVREPQQHPNHPQLGKSNHLAKQWREDGARAETGHGNFAGQVRELNPLGKLPGSVWTIPSEPLLIPQWAKDKYNLPDHFAAFPQEWPRRLILGWSPSGVCEACGEGRRPVVDKQNPRRSAEYKSLPGNPGDAARKSQTPISGGPNSGLSMPGWRKFPKSQTTITGYACACPEENANEMDSLRGTSRTRNPSTSVDRSASDDPLRLIKPAIVLDPFGGTGTVAMVARALGRDAISLDLSMDYSRLAQWRIHSSGHGAKALDRTWRERQGTL